MAKSLEYSTYRSKELNASYEAIVDGPAIMPSKPCMVPSLNFQKLREYNEEVKLAKKKKMEEKMKQGKNEQEMQEINCAYYFV